MPQLTATAVEPWQAHPKAAPNLERRGDVLITAANGTRTCVGGWNVRYDGSQPGATYRVVCDVRATDVHEPLDSLRCFVEWHGADEGRHWEYLIPDVGDDGAIAFTRLVTAPQGATGFTVRMLFRWSTTGSVTWQTPRVETAARPEPTPPVRVALVTGKVWGRNGPFRTAQDNTDFYLPLCEAAAAEKPDLIVLPEIALHWNIHDESPIDLGVPTDAPETAPFSDLAKRHGLHLLLGMYERDGDAVFNSAVLYGPDGDVAGVYRKVHLAVGGEDENGLLAGDDFPVFDTDIGRIGCNICMDSSAAESSRMAGIGGADMLLLPIMGDHRADRWSVGSPRFSEDRWKAIMRTHAMDTQLSMVVVRNDVQGTCVIDRKGEILAWNEGDRDYIIATLDLDDGYRTWNGGCFRDVNWLQRRPHLYGESTAPANVGNVAPTSTLSGRRDMSR
ncbi:MAG: carbon-nitrogen hydrolase family protein [Candidatus Poribacteria bacterium]